MVCHTEPDSEIRAAYFDCKNHKCDQKWLVPQGPGYGRAAESQEYRRHTIPTCPARYIWASSRNFLRSEIVTAAIRYPKLRLVPGAVLNQPASVGYMVEVIRGELRAFRELRSASKRK